MVLSHQPCQYQAVLLPTVKVIDSLFDVGSSSKSAKLQYQVHFHGSFSYIDSAIMIRLSIDTFYMTTFSNVYSLMDILLLLY